jgi:hypothetical protein
MNKNISDIVNIIRNKISNFRLQTIPIKTSPFWSPPHTSFSIWLKSTEFNSTQLKSTQLNQTKRDSIRFDSGPALFTPLHLVLSDSIQSHLSWSNSIPLRKFISQLTIHRIQKVLISHKTPKQIIPCHFVEEQGMGCWVWFAFQDHDDMNDLSMLSLFWNHGMTRWFIINYQIFSRD